MIAFARVLSCGNAASLLVRPESGSEQWRLLRRTDDAFTGYDDAGAVLAAQGENDRDYAVVDFSGLTNGQSYWYRLYTLADGNWSVDGDDASLTPAYNAEPLYSAPNVADFVRERMDLGLQGELAAGRLTHENGRIPVLSANPRVESIKLPAVTVILEMRQAAERAVGETVIPDIFDEDLWSECEGWLDRSSVQIAVWALNYEDRLRLRDSVQRVLMLNLPIFDAAGYNLIEVSESDSFDAESFGAPVYQSLFTFSCLHQALVRTQIPPITQVEVNADEYQ